MMKAESGGNEDVRQILIEKATDLFSLCDKESKGFITKRDMQRLREELPLSPDQLEDVFDKLDDDRNGYLTLQEFTDGFGSFLGLQASPEPSSESPDSLYRNEDESAENDMDEEQFQSLLDHIGANEEFFIDEDVKNMWAGMRKENPMLLTYFEDFLGRVIREKKQNKREYTSLEEAYKSKKTMYDKQIKKLYEEMETQIRSEKERLMAEENARELRIREELEAELKDKDSALQEILQKHKIIEESLCELNLNEVETKQENIKLQKEKDKLEHSLDESKKIIGEMTDYTENLRKNSNEEKRRRARAALQASEGIALERESLVRQLDALKSLNQRLMDEKDESLVLKRSNNLREERLSDVIENDFTGAPVPKPRRLLEKRGSTIGDYIENPSFGRNFKLPTDTLGSINDFGSESISDVEYENDQTFYENNDKVVDANFNNVVLATSVSYIENNLNVCNSPKVLNNRKLNRSNSLSDNDNISHDVDDGHPLTKSENLTGTLKNGSSKENLVDDKENAIIAVVSSQSAAFTQEKWKVKHGIYPTALKNSDHLDTKEFWKVQKTYYTEKSVDNEDCNISREEGWKVKKNSYFDNPLHDEGTNQITMNMSQHPERVYKIVFIGDSSVGKTSFINRFCKDAFNPHFSATIGVDFQVKQMYVDDRTIALQVWDTAGQERYRSITKQYFRRADGVVIMYDITSQTSFTNIRAWVQSIQEIADEHIVIQIIGNKVDLCLDENDRVISLKQAEKLADDYHAIYYEVSAKSGENVQQSMEALAGMLQEKEDEEIERVLRLKDTVKKKKCCS